MTSEANLSSFMQRFNTTYTVYYNRRHKRSDHLYQGRYKAILIEEESYLLYGMGFSKELRFDPPSLFTGLRRGAGLTAKLQKSLKKRAKITPSGRSMPREKAV